MVAAHRAGSVLGDDLRYTDLAVSDEAIPTNTLADRLRRLEEEGIVHRVRYSERPPRYTYRLTDRGRSLGPVVNAIADWGMANLAGTRRLLAWVGVDLVLDGAEPDLLLERTEAPELHDREPVVRAS